jgi:hypothetical protein
MLKPGWVTPALNQARSIGNFLKHTAKAVSNPNVCW